MHIYLNNNNINKRRDPNFTVQFTKVLLFGFPDLYSYI